MTLPTQVQTQPRAKDPTDTLCPEFCEECHKSDAMVIDSRMTDTGRRRRYQCRDPHCNYRWTTYEFKHNGQDPMVGDLSNLASLIERLSKTSAEAEATLTKLRKLVSRR